MDSKELTNKIKKRFIVDGNEKCEYTKKGFEVFVEEIIKATLKECKWEKLKSKLNKSAKAYSELKKRTPKVHNR